MRLWAPVFHVQTVEPAHLGGHALGVAEELQVRDHDIIVELVAVHAHEVHEDEVVVRVAVDDDGRALGRSGILGGGVNGVELVTVRIRAVDILEDALLVQVVIPGHHAGGEGIGLGAGALDIGLTVLGGLEGVVGHEFAGEAAREAVRGEEERGAPEDDPFQCHSYAVVGYYRRKSMAPNRPSDARSMIAPARRTPSSTNKTLFLKSMSRMLAARVPVQAPVPGSGMPTNRSRAT